VTYTPYASRGLATLVAVSLTPVWGVLSVPLGAMFYILLVVGGGIYALVHLVRRLADKWG
jgi:hypothetical protein